MDIGKNMRGSENSRWRTPEFKLVVYMLIVLVVLVIAILLVPPLIWVNQDAATKELAKELLDYKKTILSIILTAFGAWVGAGAAYFFGRENLKIATQSMLDLRGTPPKERLRKTPIREVPPRPLDWFVKTGDKLQTVLARLKEEDDRWFIPIVKDGDTLETVLHEEAIWRFVEKESQAGTSYDQIQEKKLAEVIAYTKTLPAKVIDRLMGIYVAVSGDKSAGEANELMNSKNVFIAIVVDEKGKPVQYITTGDIRSLLMRFD